MMGTERLAAAVPPHVREVCARLTASGHQAVVVGGCVRDVLLGRTPGDWDVATSAHPEEVLKLFRHTIATGLQHGTVTVVMGKGVHTHVEVTTYRGEGAYSDARRPDSVTFGVPLIEDLKRRDLVVNAMAYDPSRDELIDPFDGQADLDARVLRAVGNPVERFTEDGLRVMRAVRFAAQLEFQLETATEASIAEALPSLSKVSRERVCEEVRKILKARRPSLGLAVALRTGIMANVARSLVEKIGDTELDWLGWIDAIPREHPVVRLAAMCVPAADGTAALLKELKFSNAEIETAAQLVSVAHVGTTDTPGEHELRKILSRIRRERRDSAIELWAARYPRNDVLVERARHVLAEQHPLEQGDLVITGKDLMEALQMKPGPALGRILAKLLDYVLEEPTRNTRETLLAHAQQLELALGR